MGEHPGILGVVGGIVGILLLGIVVWLAIAYTGAYNVAASDQHFDVVRWTFNTTLRRSVANRAGGAEIPEDPPESLIAEGAGHYAESCAYCHGGPGQEPTRWSRGMRPEPPHLAEAASEWPDQEIFWIVSNGFKMTGMPAFGEHSPEEITAITAFVSNLPGLSADDYRNMTATAQGSTQESPPPGTAEPQSQ